MARIGSKLRSLEGGRVAFKCPGCGYMHHVRVEGEGRPMWSFNGNPDAPTFSPSILVTYDGADAGIEDAPPARCHSYVTDGRIQFLNDCTHDLRGQTVDLPDLDTP
ncbi:DUF6527 family protein [Maritimibacter sp. DP1N21-5]|uniref:DUF6527 family protein n=1 Tax=Maritimibacter sp. DP1N21-5 TaxID=2836867 RepID=UPI001C43D744|nr:DUF6527 family protein [Maritimibacter sp. DP1N21-5]MBV7408781.1 ammonia monooxygenase [Maritimibacter sp. DP1N21-5]